MKKKLEIPVEAKVRVIWNVLPYDYNQKNKDAARTLAAQKYGIPEKNIEIVPVIKSITDDGTDSTSVRQELHDLCNTDNQLKLFKKFLETYNIEGYDWDTIKSIDADVNSQIQYEKYDQYRRYKLKWIKWDNFLSYGEDNFFNFETLDGLVLLNGAPANQTGKTTFAIDLLHFLLFGKPTPAKADVNFKIFNKYTKATQVKVEGCINIDGTDYVIRRTLNRPARFTTKSKISGTVEYFKVDGDNSYTSLKDFDSTNADVALNAESVMATNKVIKDAIGKESDFDLIICATSKSLDELIDKGDTERGKLMTRWLGLNVIDDKYKVAKEIHDRLVVNYVSKTKDKNVLTQEIQLNNDTITNNKQAITLCNQFIASLTKSITDKTKESDSLKSSKTTINEALLKLNEQTINNQIEFIKNDGIKIGKDIVAKTNEINDKQTEIDNQTQLINSLGTVNFSISDLQTATTNHTNKMVEINKLLSTYNQVKDKKKNLQSGEFCPTCKQRLQNVNNTALIAECDVELNTIQEKGKVLRQEEIQLKAEVDRITELGKQAENVQKEKEKLTTLNNELNKLKLAQSALEVMREKRRNEYKEQQQLLNEYNANKDAIEKNEDLDRQILAIDNIINGFRNDLIKQSSSKETLEKENVGLEKINKDNKADIATIEKEEVLENNWQIYLELLGKNGVSKMEIRELTPIINIKLKEFLSDIVDFDVEVDVTDKNDVVFNITTEDNGEKVVGDLTSGSGFERTCAALALRFVLGSITSIPQPNFFVIDEVIGGGVASENYDKVKKLFEKEVYNHRNGIDFIIHCTHIDEIKDWHKSIITIQKRGRVSSVSSSTMG